MSILANIEVKRINETGTCHEVYVDGIKINRVASVNIDYESCSIPKCTIVLNGVTEVNEKMFVDSQFRTDDIRECIKYLALMVQFDDDFKEACLATIESALKESKDLPIEGTANKVLEKLIE